MMAETALENIKNLKIDLKNFRTVPQKKEVDAIKAMISIKPDRFYAVMESIIEDGYLPTENIIVLKDGTDFVVKEGNRRIASLKLIHGFYNIDQFGIPQSIVDKVSTLKAAWKRENLKVPCTIFSENEADVADRVVSLTHGKGEMASRDKWSSVATARHNRDANGISEPALDLLEKYLKVGNNINNQQKSRWAGEYPLSILQEALRLIHQRLAYNTINELVKKYPKIKHLNGFEDLIRDIGLDQLSFKMLRDANNDFVLTYGIPQIKQRSTTTGTGGKPSSANTNQSKGGSSQTIKPVSKAYSVTDPKFVISTLRKFSPKGNNRQKVVTLRDEIKKIKIKDTPLAFCFLLRSMFEISAKAYCNDYSISIVRQLKNGKSKDKTLVELLKDVTNHLTNNKKNIQKVKILHGAYTEISKKTGILSVTSMNNLVHNSNFSIQPGDICILFGNIYPLLEEMN